MKPRNINIRLSQEAYGKIKADADRRGLTLTGYLCELAKVQPLPMGRPPHGCKLPGLVFGTFAEADRTARLRPEGCHPSDPLQA